MPFIWVVICGFYILATTQDGKSQKESHPGITCSVKCVLSQQSRSAIKQLPLCCVCDPSSFVV